MINGLYVALINGVPKIKHKDAIDVSTPHALADLVAAVCSETELANAIGAHTTPNAHHAQSHTLASHSTKAHTELTGVTAAQHHAKYTNDEADARIVAYPPSMTDEWKKYIMVYGI